MIRIAATSSDGRNVNLHFGMAREFLIFDIEDDRIVREETRVNLPWCGENAEAKYADLAIERAASILSDCEAILTAKIGECAWDELMGAGILPFESGGNINEAIEAYLKYRNSARSLIEEK